MGAWGARSFENDDAMDWIAGLAEGSGDGAIREALSPIVATDDAYLEAPESSIAVAAAEAVAAARGHPTTSPPKEVASWVEKGPNVASDMVELARKAVDRIVRKSELKDLWDQSDSAEEWRRAMTDLRKRLE